MERRRLGPSTVLGIGAAALVGGLAGCASAPSVASAEQIDVPASVRVEGDVVAAYAVGEDEGFVFTALEMADGWCLAIQSESEAQSDADSGVTGCTEGDEITVGGDQLPTVLFTANGVGHAPNGRVVSDWVVVPSAAP